jgi:tetratricopeptide (TPR) repeat protein
MIEINLGIISGIFREWRDARLYFNNALKNFEKSSDHKRIALIYNNLGMLDYNSGKLNQALEEFDQSIEDCFKLNYLPVLGLSFLGKAITYLKMNNLNLAEAYSDKAMEICSKVDDKLSIADIYKVKGIIEMELRNYLKAENLLKTSLRMNVELGNKLNEAETSVELGKLYNKLNDKSQSRKWLQQGIEYYKWLGSKEKIKEIESLLA